MCHSLAGIICEWCVDRLSVNQEEKTKIWYGMEVFLELLWKLAGIIVIGMRVKNGWLYFLSIFSFCLLRFWVGGWHFHSSMVCFGFMVLIGWCPAYFMDDYMFPGYWSKIFFVISFVIIEKWSLYGRRYPAEENKKKEKYVPTLFCCCIS